MKNNDVWINLEYRYVVVLLFYLAILEWKWKKGFYKWSEIKEIVKNRSWKNLGFVKVRVCVFFRYG